MKHAVFIKLTCISLILVSLLSLKVSAQTSTPAVPNFIRGVAWNTDGSQIAIATHQGAIQILDINRQLLRGLQSASPDPITTIAWSPDGTKLATGGQGRLLKIWDVVTGRVLFTPEASAYHGLRSVAWSADSSKLVSVDLDVQGTPDPVRIWNVATGRLVRALPVGATLSADWNPDGIRLALGRLLKVEIWDTAASQVVNTLNISGYGMGVKWSPDGSKIASIDDSGVAQVWDTTGRLIHTFRHTNIGLSVAWSPDGSKLVSTGHDHAVRIWDIATGQSLQVIQANDSVFKAAWSPYGGRLAYGDVAQATTSASSVASSGLHIIVPPSTLKDLQAIARKCVTRAEMLTTLIPDLDTSRLTVFVDKVKAAGSQINPGCAADLLAVAESLQK